MPTLDANTILLLQAGNVNSGSFDPFDEICDRANEAGAWVHIDGAFGLWAAGCRNLRHLTKGIENANSWSVDGHKTLNTPYDNGVLLCNDKEALIQALQASGSYIVYTENRDGMLYTPEMSRRARAIELWACLKYLGKEGVNEKSSVGCAAALATLDCIEHEDLIENSVTLGQHALDRLTEMKSKLPLIHEIRGLGLHLGVELRRDGKPASDEADAVLYHSLARGLSYKVGGGCVLTLSPPMTITREQLDHALDIVEQGIQSMR